MIGIKKKILAKAKPLMSISWSGPRHVLLVVFLNSKGQHDHEI